VWEKHFEISLRRGEGCFGSAQPAALVLMNEEKIETGKLQHGDLIELGSIRLRFWLASRDQKALRAREALVWFSMVALLAVQTALIWLLLR
jgi:hypothetical protein